NITLKHNTIFGQGFDGSFGNSAIITYPSNNVNMLYEDNLLGGGGYTLYCQRDGGGSNFQVLNNHFTTRFSAKVGFYAPGTNCGDTETVSGNVIDGTGKPADLR